MCPVRSVTYVSGRSRASRDGATHTAERLQQRAHSYDEGAELLRRLIAHANSSGGTGERSDS